MDTDIAQQPTVTDTPRRSFGSAVLTATAVVALGVGFGAGYVSHTSSSASSSATTAVHGTLTLPDGGYSSVGTTCSGSGGYQDINAGVAVTIGDQTGKTLAVTSLAAGTFGGGGCQFAFSTNVAAATTYTVTISHRGTQTFMPAEVASGFNMTLAAS
ncbi:hypothetical protein KGQ20_21615 [Catenulispora sp. NF23]|uniref:Uncharacterized protein n=1 Tax=Catenulispora pinistramenti TaxID=2705254 RepID=A0ABS5KQK5_9ACTN|nr:hypothetical protein [Catenulispora pinistramenti]MBS2535367.1 hypothetical protein [Catenulispora pinistramenti]MBS2548337.1 hypothetical protein [Catenulispora pinistramenti]